VLDEESEEGNSLYHIVLLLISDLLQERDIESVVVVPLVEISEISLLIVLIDLPTFE
jgi:hypothetical protein